MAIVSDVEIRLRADIARLQSDMTAARKTVEGALGAMSDAADKLKSMLGLTAAAFGGFQLISFAKDAALLNARFETMGVVMGVAGNNAGYTRAQMADLEQSLQKTGISAIKSRENLTSLATANIDLSNASKLARAAQDLAVVGNVNSSEAFSRLVNGIKSGEVEVLRTLGLNVSFENSYKRLATQLGTTSDKLTEQQKIQARTAEALRQSATYAGIYEEALGTAGKQIQSLSRYLEDAKVKIGEMFNETLTFAVTTWTDALKAANKELDQMGGAGGSSQSIGHSLAVGFQEVSKVVLVLGANILYVLKVAGTEIAGFAAALAQVFTAPLRAINGIGAALDLALSGKFSESADRAGSALGELSQGMRNIAMISQEVGKDTDAQAAALKAYENSVMGATVAVKVQTQAEKDAADAKEKSRIAAGIAARAAQELEAKRLAAAEKARADAKKAFDEAQTWYKTTSENSKDKIADLLQEIATGTKLTEAEKNRIKVLDSIDQKSKSLTAAQKAKTKADQDAIVYLDNLNTARQADLRLIKEVTEAAQKDVDAARDQTKSLEDQIKYYGLTEEAVLRLQAAEMSRRADMEENDIEADRLRRLVVETNKQADAQQKLTKMKADTSFWAGLEDAAHQTFLSIQDGGKDLWTRLKESAKNIFFEWLYQMTLKKWIINVGLATGGTGAVSGIAGAATVAGAAGSASAVTGQLSTLAGLGSLITSAGGIVTGAMQTAGALLTGTIGFGQTLSAGWGALTSGSAAGASAGLASIAGVVAPIAIAALVGSKLLGAAFGMGAKTVNSTTLSGTLTPTGADISTLQAWSQKGGWFRSDKSGVDSTSVGSAQNSAFASTYKAILDVSKTLGDVIGADTSALSTRAQQLKIDLTGITDATAQQEAVVKFFAGVADTISTELVPGLAAFQVEGEALSTTLQRVVTDYAAVDAVLGTIGKSMGSVGVASIAARENLIKVAGGLDALSSGVSYFQQNFLSDSERLAMTQKQVGAAMTELGLTSVTTIDQFKQTALGLDLNTEAGAKLFAQMLALAPAFKTVTDAADAAAKAQADAAAATKAAAEQAAKDAAEAAKTAANSAFDALKTALDARKGVLADAFSSVTDWLNNGITALTGSLDSLRGLSQTIANTRGQGAGAATSRDNGAAFIAQAFKQAQSTGVLPSTDSLQSAISSAMQDGSAQYATALDYQRSQLLVSNNLEGIYGVAQGQISSTQMLIGALQAQQAASKAAYDAQIASLDQIAASAQSQIDAINAVNNSVQSLGMSLSAFVAAVSAAGGSSAGMEWQQSSALANAATGQSGGFVMFDSAAVVRELQAMSATMDAVHKASAQTAGSTDKLATQFDQVSAGGNALATETLKANG
ncbi:MAG: hypothetical protein NTX28_07605 [Novosphingobium sp.]|nr:hypothetical protein [Novosphingobium sp.]